MTIMILGQVLARRWYVVVIGLLVTTTGVAFVNGRTGVYWAQTDVVFLAPKSDRYPNSINQTSGSVIAMAGLVANQLDGNDERSATSSAGATLAGSGVREGIQVRVPNSGGNRRGISIDPSSTCR